MPLINSQCSMKEHCHPCDTLFIILWGKGTPQMETIQMLREIYKVRSVGIELISRTFFARSISIINWVTFSIQKDKQHKHEHLKSTHMPVRSQGCIIVNTSSGPLLPPGGATCHDKEHFALGLQSIMSS